MMRIRPRRHVNRTVITPSPTLSKQKYLLSWPLFTEVFGDQTPRIEKRVLCIRKGYAMFDPVSAVLGRVPFETGRNLHMVQLPYIYMAAQLVTAGDREHG